MRKTATTLSDAALTALRQATFTDDGQGVRLAGTLSRDVYVEVAEALKRAGFKWHRQREAHVLINPGNVADSLRTLAVILDSGVAPHKNPDCWYPTPPSVAKQVAQLIREGYYRSGHGFAKILEPSVGEGALLKAIADTVDTRNWYATMIDTDLDRLNYASVRLRGRFKTLVSEQTDFLEWETGQRPYTTFDLIAMNPPFDNRVVVKHLLHAWSLLHSGGRLVAIAIPSVLDHKDLGRLITNSEEIPAGAFSESGTDIATVLITMDKPNE